MSVLKFQFPSNGKAYPKEERELISLWGVCFNSLQTGKPIQSETQLFWNNRSVGSSVSIPFKRESLSKDQQA